MGLVKNMPIISGATPPPFNNQNTQPGGDKTKSTPPGGASTSEVQATGGAEAQQTSTLAGSTPVSFNTSHIGYRTRAGQKAKQSGIRMVTNARKTKTTKAKKNY